MRALVVWLVLAALLLPSVAHAQEPVDVVAGGPFVPDLSPADLLPLQELIAAPAAPPHAEYTVEAAAEPFDAAMAPAPLALPSGAPEINASFAAEMLWREGALVYYVNVYRSEAGLLPVRWNRELSDASRWFAHDAVVTKPACGHTDSLGRGPGTRIRVFGYRDPIKWAQVIACGFTEPAAVVQAWMNSPTQRPLLLDPELREAGPGYYFSTEKQRGYVVLALSAQQDFAPMVINDENLRTPSATVTLAIHPQPHNPVQMKVSNTGVFSDVQWEPFVTTRSWTLTTGIGWKTVYVITRDALGRTTQLSDQIYYGAALPIEQMTLEQTANIGFAYAISQWPVSTQEAQAVRLSMGWIMDGLPPALVVLRGSSEVTPNPAAVGGSELRLPGAAQQATVRGQMNTLPTDRILTAYYRLKAESNVGTAEVARLTIRIEGRTFGPVVIAANDFDAANAWQEFGITFAFPSVNSVPQVDVELQRTGPAAITLDAVRFYGQPMPLQSPLLWTAGEGPFRSQGVQARFVGATGMSEPHDVAFSLVDDLSGYGGNAHPLVAWPGSLRFSVPDSASPVQKGIVVVCPLACAENSWQAVSSAPWLTLEAMADGLVLSANPAGMAEGMYDGFITVVGQVAPSAAGVLPASGAAPAAENYLSTIVLVRLVIGADTGVAEPPPLVVTRQVFVPTVRR